MSEQEWSIVPIRPHVIIDGTVVTQWDSPPDLFSIRLQTRDNEGRRVARFLADVNVLSGDLEEAERNAGVVMKALSAAYRTP